MLSEHFHGSVQLYSLLGIVPIKDKALMAGLGYDFLRINRKRYPKIAPVLDALEQHLPDYAYGSPENIHRWEQLRRNKGRARKT